MDNLINEVPACLLSLNILCDDHRKSELLFYVRPWSMISLTVHGEKSASYNTCNNYSISLVGFHSETVYCIEDNLGEYCSLIGRQSNSENQNKQMLLIPCLHYWLSGLLSQNKSPTELVAVDLN